MSGSERYDEAGWVLLDLLNPHGDDEQAHDQQDKEQHTEPCEDPGDEWEWFRLAFHGLGSVWLITCDA